MGAKDDILALVNGLSEEACQRLLDGVDVYGPGAFGLDIYGFVAAAKTPDPVEPREGDLYIEGAAEWMAGLKRTDTPLLNMLRFGGPESRKELAEAGMIGK